MVFALYYLKESNLLRKLTGILGRFPQFAIDTITANLIVSNPSLKNHMTVVCGAVLGGKAKSHKRKLEKAEARSLTRNN